MSPPTRYPHDDPREWLNRARSNLAKAHITRASDDVYPEDVCFEAQQAAEKAIKAVLLSRQVDFPRVHDIATLLTLVSECGIALPDEIAAATELTDYAVATRYPGLEGDVSNEDCDDAIACAEAVLQWAERMIKGDGAAPGGASSGESFKA
jgi:HEPN domain-containing protein